MQENTKKYTIIDEDGLDNYLFSLLPGNRVFFYGDLGSGKSTFIRRLLRKHFHDPTLVVRSPTYTYYERYGNGPYIYHMDLYRLDDIDSFSSIGGSEILQDPESIVLIEWPQILEGVISPTKRVEITQLDGDSRVIEIT